MSPNHLFILTLAHSPPTALARVWGTGQGRAGQSSIRFDEFFRVNGTKRNEHNVMGRGPPLTRHTFLLHTYMDEKKKGAKNRNDRIHVGPMHDNYIKEFYNPYFFKSW